MKTSVKQILFFSWALLVGCSGSEAKNAEPNAAESKQDEARLKQAANIQPNPKEEEHKGEAVLMVIAPKNFRDEELFVTREVLEGAGYKITLASTSTDEATGMLGGKAKPDIVISSAIVEDFRSVVFVGGSGTTAILEDEPTLKLAKDAAGAGKLVAAICMAPEILANAGLLAGKKATCWSGGLEHLKSKGAEAVEQPVVIDGMIVTGNGPQAAKAFGEAIVELLGNDN